MLTVMNKRTFDVIGKFPPDLVINQSTALTHRMPEIASNLFAHLKSAFQCDYVGQEVCGAADADKIRRKRTHLPTTATAAQEWQKRSPHRTDAELVFLGNSNLRHDNSVKGNTHLLAKLVARPHACMPAVVNQIKRWSN